MYLFSDANLFAVLEQQKKNLADEVEALAPNRLLNTDEQQLCQELLEDYAMEAPTLRPEGIALDGYGETDVDLRHDQPRAVVDPTRPVYVRGMGLTVVVPFDGDPELLRCQPSRFTTNPPDAELRGNELRFVFSGTNLDPKSVRREVDGALGQIESYLGAMRTDLARFNDEVKRLVQQAVTGRKQRLLKQNEVVANLGIPVRRRTDAPTTHSPPVRRRRAAVDRAQETDAKDLLSALNVEWKKAHGFKLFDLASFDPLDSLRGQCRTREDYHTRVLALAELMDDLNESALREVLPADRASSISPRHTLTVLEAYVAFLGYPNGGEAVTALRKVQRLRNLPPTHSADKGGSRAIEELKALGFPYPVPAQDWPRVWGATLSLFTRGLQLLRDDLEGQQ